MPGLNRMGPEGKGSMTGRGLGRCNSNFNGTTNENVNKIENSKEPVENLEQINRDPYLNPQMGFYPRGMGRGFRRGCNNGFARGRGFAFNGRRNRGNF